MNSTGRKSGPPIPAKETVQEKTQDKPNKPPASLRADDDEEDGDIATPKRDRYGNDDEPL
jgi:hypothetical protein